MLKLALLFVVDKPAHYKPEQWENGLKVFRDLCAHLKRRDAVCGFDEDINNEPTDTIESIRSIRSIQQMKNLFRFQQVFSLLGCQKVFREQLADESKTGNPEINKDIEIQLM
jgi:hypothetical protein